MTGSSAKAVLLTFLALVVGVVALTGCDYTAEAVETVCEDHGGVRAFHSRGAVRPDLAICMDGVVREVP